MRIQNERIKAKADAGLASLYFFTNSDGKYQQFELLEAIEAKEWELGRELDVLPYDPKTTFPEGILEREYELVALITWLNMYEKHQEDMAALIYRSHHF